MEESFQCIYMTDNCSQAEVTATIRTRKFMTNRLLARKQMVFTESCQIW